MKLATNLQRINGSRLLNYQRKRQLPVPEPLNGIRPISVRFPNCSLNISFHHLSFSLVVVGATIKATIPKNLAAGEYLLRTEIIALQLALSLGGAEFYPACARLKIGGTGTGAPAASDLVSLPGAYSDNDPGIYTPNVYNPGFKYVFPGPPIAAFVGDLPSGTSITAGPSGGNSGSSGSSVKPSSGKTASSGNSGTPTTGTKLPSSSTTPGKKCNTNAPPRKRSFSYSRIMQRLVHHRSDLKRSPSRK